MITVNNVAELYSFVDNALPNDKCIYYTGMHIGGSLVGGILANTVWELAIKGKVYLVRKKLNPFDYEFIAIKASNPPLHSLVPLPHEPDRNGRERKSNVHTMAQPLKTRKSVLERVTA